MRRPPGARLRTVRRHEPDAARGERYAERLDAQRRLVPVLLGADGQRRPAVTTAPRPRR